MKSFLWNAAAVWMMAALLPGAAWASGYQIGETPQAPVQASPKSAGAGAGPIRLARFSFVQGNVTWRTNDSAAWSLASVNLPLRQGAEIWVTNGGRAEVQFDDGSLLRLGNGAVVRLQTLYSDMDGEFTELNLSEGLAALKLRGTPSIYQVDTPFVSVKSEGPTKVRIGVDSSVEVAVRLGRATVEGSGAKTTLSNGDYVNLAEASTNYTVNPLPDEDSWDRFNDDRDQQLADAETDHRLPPDIALVAGNLNEYGAWHDDPQYGQVWCPRETDAGWRPYQHGHWVWVEPFGWTWVANEAWGWAPYHYGTWVSEPYGWAWVPGPAHQYWCPAVVGFSEYDGEIAWAPLAPGEVHYPVYLADCYEGRGHDWTQFFSVGGAAVYYPHGGGCDPHPFNNVTVNRAQPITPSIPALFGRPAGGTIVNRNIYGPSHGQNSGFVPTNARHSGVTIASAAVFGGAGQYRPQAADGSAFFRRGHPVGMPVSVRPTAVSATPSRVFLPDMRPEAAVQARPVFRAPLPDRVARFAPPQRMSVPPRVPSRVSPVSVEVLPPAAAPSAPAQPPFFVRRDFGDAARRDTVRVRPVQVPPGNPVAAPSPSVDSKPIIVHLPPAGGSSQASTSSPSRPSDDNSAEFWREYRRRSQAAPSSRPAGSRSQEQKPQEQKPQEQKQQEQPAQEQKPEEQPQTSTKSDNSPAPSDDGGERRGRGRF